MFSIDGLVSGLDTASIIEGLVALQQSQVDRLTFKKSEIQVQQRAFQGVESRLLSLRSQMSQLNRSTGSSFSSRKVVSSHENIITATAGNDATEGSYNLRVTSRAQAHQLASTGFTSTSQAISTGTISFQVGDRPVTEIKIDGTNNNVNGLVQAINSQSSDVSAAIVHDQASNSDRILLTSKHSGAANEITITNNLDVATGDIARPDFSGPAVQAATNAIIQLGSGAGAISAEYETNQVEGLIAGVTLNLQSVDLNQAVQIQVSRDTSKATDAIKDFVEEYNSLINYINEQTRFNTETQSASPLLGNRSISVLKNQLSSMMTEVVPGLDSGLNRFSQIGIGIDGTGRLTLNSAQLEKALTGEIEGLDSTEIPRLFGMTGSSTNVGIEFTLGSTRTKASSTPYQVDILQAAERATITANSSLANSIVIDSSNRQFKVSVDGIESESLTLAEGTYTQSQLASHLESVINSSAKLSSHDVSVSLDSGKLKLTSTAYGSNSRVASVSGTAASVLGFSGSEAGVGKDVAGSFIVNGKIESATGTGRILIGNSDNENTADLQIRVTLDPSQVGSGIEGEMTVSRGITSRMDQFLGEFLDSSKGSLATINSGFDLRLESIDTSIERVNQISASKREYLIKQFSALERALSELKTTSSVVSSQLAGIR